jgi:hypothetical protein
MNILLHSCDFLIQNKFVLQYASIDGATNTLTCNKILDKSRP